MTLRDIVYSPHFFGTIASEDSLARLAASRPANNAPTAPACKGRTLARATEPAAAPNACPVEGAWVAGWFGADAGCGDIGEDAGEEDGVEAAGPEAVGPLDEPEVGLGLLFRVPPGEELVWPGFRPECGPVPGKDRPAVGPLLPPGPPISVDPAEDEPPEAPHDPCLLVRLENPAPPRLEAIERETFAPAPAASAAPATLGPPPN